MYSVYLAIMLRTYSFPRLDRSVYRTMMRAQARGSMQNPAKGPVTIAAGYLVRKLLPHQLLAQSPELVGVVFAYGVWA